MPAEIYGPAGALVALAFVVGLLLKGNQPYGLVPGWIYLQERAQREKAEVQAAQNAEALTCSRRLPLMASLTEDPGVPDLRVLFERLFLPWYNQKLEHKRNVHTRRVERRSVISRMRADRVIAVYQAAESNKVPK